MKDDKKFKKRLMSVGSFVCLFAIAGAITYALVPTTSVKGGSTGGNGTTDSSDNGGSGNTDLTLNDQLIAKLSGGLGGMSVDIDADIRIPSKVEGKDNHIQIENGGGVISIKDTSFDTMSFDLSLPVSYNGYSRQLDLVKTADNLYISTANLDDDTTDDVDEAWDLKYRIATTEQTYSIDGEDVVFSAGDFGYFLETVINAVGGSKAMSSLTSSVSTSSLNFDTDALLASLNAMVSEEVSGGYEFYLDLALNDKISLPIGISTDSNVDLKGISFPHSKHGASAYELSNGISIDLDMACGTVSEVNIAAPDDAASYVNLFNTQGYITNLFKYIDAAKFEVDADLSISHDISETESEEMVLEANVATDLSDIKNPDMVVDLALTGLENEVEVGTHNIMVAYLPTLNSDNVADADAYLNINNILKLHSSRTTIDGVIGNIKDSMQNFSSDSQSAFDSMGSLFSGLSDSIDKVTNSSLISGVGDGVYSEIIPLIKSIDTIEGKLSITFDLSVLGLGGNVVASLSQESDSSSFGQIYFNDVSFYDFTLNGSVEITASTASSLGLPSDDSAESYHDLWRLDPMSKQIASFLDTQSLAFSVEGSYLDNSLTDANGNAGVGFTFDGTAALDLVDDCGTGEIQFTDRQKDYVQNHYVDIDVMGPEGENESDSVLSSDTIGVNNMLFDYSTSGPASQESRESSLLGRFSISSLNDVIDFVMELAGSTDSRITRFTSSITEATTTSLIGSLTSGEYFALMEYQIITDVSYTNNSTSFTLQGSALGLKNDIVITLNFLDDGSLSGLKVNTTINTSELNLALNLDQIGLSSDTYDYFGADSGNWKLWHNYELSEFIDFSSVRRLLQVAVGSATLGNGLDSANEDLATYHIKGSLDATLASADLDFYIALDGDKVSVRGTIVCKMSFLWTYTTTLYYETDVAEGSGNVYLYRKKEPLIGRTKYDSALVSSDDFIANMPAWLVNYMMGLSVDVSSSDDDSSDTSEALRMDKVLTPYDDKPCFSYSEDVSGNPSWYLGLDLEELAHMSFLNDAGISLSAKTVYDESGTKSWQTFTSVSVSTKLVFLGVSADLDLKNISDSNVYSECWSEVSSDFNSNYSSRKWATPTAVKPSDV